MKRFIVRKYVMAKSAKDAIGKEKKTEVDEVWVDDKWLELEDAKSIGFDDRGK